MNDEPKNLAASRLTEILANHEATILDQWLKEMSNATKRSDLMKDSELRAQCSLFLRLVRQGVETGSVSTDGPTWQPVRDLLADVSRTRAQQGFTPTETATFVLSVKKPLFERLRARPGVDANSLADDLWAVTELVAEREAKIHAAEAEKARHELKITHDELEARVAQRTKELADSNGQIRELTGKLFKLQDDERRRIARELHDSTGQMLTAMKMNLDRLKSKATKSDYKDLIAETISINDDLTSQLRTMSYLLHPPLLDEIGLPSAIQWYTKGFAQRSGIKVNAEIVADLGRLPNDMELAIFRFVQEALTNIHRHSGSRTADIRIVRQDDRIHVEVVDSGNGIAPEKLRGDHVIQGIGIMGIQERVRQLGRWK